MNRATFRVIVSSLAIGCFVILGGCMVPPPAARPAPDKKPVTPSEAASTTSTAPVPKAAPADDGKLRIIAFGAHPDDCEYKAGGVAALWAKEGHHVKFVSVSNGDIGHWRMAGGPLAQRRAAEVEKAAEILNISTEVLDIHDGEVMPTLENRRIITRLIREWKADIVLGHRPNDYHPDHRYSSMLVQDSGYMVTVPFFCPDVPPLRKNPIFLYLSDGFQRPNPFRPDVVVAIDDVVEQKLDALGVIVSQFFEGGANGHAGLIPEDEEGRAERHRQVRERFRSRCQGVADKYRDELIKKYGADRGAKVKYAEAFEVCEYGRQPSAEELMETFR